MGIPSIAIFEMGACYSDELSSLSEPPVPSTARCALASLVLVLVVFGDVVFAGASLAPLDYDRALLSDHASPATVSLYPESKNRTIVDSWGDIGAASWQYQSAVKFMAYCLRTGESPWWNPFDATGRMEPESMIDIPFSAITLIIAGFGGGSTAFSFVLLGVYFVAAFTLLLTLTRYLGVSFLAGCAGCAAYLLNGFALGNLNTQIGQPYFVAPVALLSLFAFLEQPAAGRFVLAALSQALLFLITEFPTMVLVEISVCCIVLASCLAKANTRKKGLQTILLLCSAPVVGFCLVAFLYLPIFEANLYYLDVIRTYDARPSAGYSLQSALSLFTPKHFWQSYRAFRPQSGWPPLQTEPWVFHIGVIVSLLAASGLARFRSTRTTVISIVSAFLVAVAAGEMFSIPPFTLIDHLPFFSFVRNEYWPALAGMPIAVLAALGLDSQGRRGAISFGIVAVSIAASFGFLFIKLGIPVSEPERAQVFIFVAIFVFGVGAVSLLQMPVAISRQLRWFLASAVLLEGVYYMNSLHPARSHRDEHLPETIEWVKQQLRSPGGDRVLDIGGTGIMPNWGGGIQVPEIGAVEMSILREYKRFFKREIGSGVFLALYGPGTSFKFSRESLSAVGVRFVIADREFVEGIAELERLGLKPVRHDKVRIILENPSPKPRAFLTASLVSSELAPWQVPVLNGGGATTSDSRMIDAARQAGIPGQPTTALDLGTAKIEEYHHTRLRIQTASRVPAMLVITDSWHPNWKALVDRVPAYVGCVDLAFRGIALPAGNHTVELSYAPRTRTVGAVISISTLLLILSLLLFDRLRPDQFREFFTAMEQLP